ncbi:MAG TPA: hypothetical protein VKT82_26280 [Ktedonobacterales bacterium]|nr:hypothetical protein [Ktedonobacterales bacterium]
MQISVRRLFHDLRTNLRPRELFYWTLGNGVHWGLRLTMRVQLYGMAEYYGPPASATLIIATHKRDWDPILFASQSYYHRGWLAPDGRRVGFAGRADMWDRGFLATVVGYRNWPDWAQRLLDATSFAPIANRMRAHPILRVPEFTLRQYARMLFKEEGDVPLSDILSVETLSAFARRADALQARHQRQAAAQQPAAFRLSDVLGWEYRALTSRPVRASHLTPARYQQMREWLRATIDAQLDTLARSLDSGDTLWFAPEGAVTLDGRVMRLRGGLHALLARVRPDTRCLPSNVTYDFMTNKHRMTACLAVGPELSGLRDLERSAQTLRVAQALARQTTVTMSQLASARLLALLDEQCYQFDPKVQAPIMLAQARRLVERGAWVQRDLLTERDLRRRLRAFVAYAERQHLLVADEEDGYLICAKAMEGSSSRYWENPVRYCANELATLEAALQLARSITAPLPALGAAPAPEDEAKPSDQMVADASAAG